MRNKKAPDKSDVSLVKQALFPTIRLGSHDGINEAACRGLSSSRGARPAVQQQEEVEMTIKKTALSLALGSVGLPSMLLLASNAYAVSFPVNLDSDEQTAETFEIYGKVRLSVDYADSDLGGAEENKSIGLTDGSVGLSSNTTIIGFRGSYAVKEQPYTVVWQVEQNFNPDTATDDTWSNRDTFLGVETPLGLFRVGLMDIPFKRAGLANTIFVTTVGDPFAILGKSSQNGSRDWTCAAPTRCIGTAKSAM
ncbi:hypothetical protein CEK62_06010 [Alcanivorax sp. N3-2A]|nr:hypothetical protein CEK62_06010 [Alcanivorax sp. N3-2A]|tara:strand:+ start:38061 stop:38813 length:753 start_codon:yes stop_codon:yes gene_type:complete